MGNLFNIDNPIFSILSKVCDMLFVSIAFIFLCLPIITIGPASTALYYTVVKVIRRERGYIFREFWRSFRLNFKRSAILGVLLTIALIILSFDLIYAWGLTAPDSSKGSLLMGVFIGITFLVLSFSLYVFPILSRFDMTIKQLVKAAAFMSMRHILSTFIMIVVCALHALVIIYFFPFIFIAPATLVLVNSFMLERVFKKYMPEVDGSGEETSQDKWYLE